MKTVPDTFLRSCPGRLVAERTAACIECGDAGRGPDRAREHAFRACVLSFHSVGDAGPAAQGSRLPGQEPLTEPVLRPADRLSALRPPLRKATADRGVALLASVVQG